ncbi:MAG: hypothetical protein WA364_16870 [Candidatus Nitrosopolaris sp.]
MYKNIYVQESRQKKYKEMMLLDKNKKVLKPSKIILTSSVGLFDMKIRDA